jgi:hypothetical protein
MNEIKQDMSPWEVWISERYINSDKPKYTSYDRILELTAEHFNMTTIAHRKINHQDRISFICKWWKRNKRLMGKYSSMAKVGKLLGNRDSASVYHHIDKRKLSHNYEENVADIKDFLES